MWKRKCPACGEEIPYKRKNSKVAAEKKNTSCLLCAMRSEKVRKKISESHKGKTQSEESNKKRSDTLKGRKFSDETLKRMSKSQTGRVITKKHRENISKTKTGKKIPKLAGDNNPARRLDVRKKISKTRTKNGLSIGEKNPMYGKCAYDIWVKKYGKEEADKRKIETNKKKRLSAIKRIKNTKGQVIPNSNPNAIRIIRAKAKELGITDLRDAETPGGEFQICGYYVDGFSKEKNIVFEYNEPFHKNQTERDERRKKEIIKELGCKFIVIWE